MIQVVLLESSNSIMLFSQLTRRSRMDVHVNYDNMIDFMRADLENDMAYSKIINAAKKSIESQGKNFAEEFEKWKKEREV